MRVETLKEGRKPEELISGICNICGKDLPLPLLVNASTYKSCSGTILRFNDHWWKSTTPIE